MSSGSNPVNNAQMASGCPPHAPVPGGTACFEFAQDWELVENHCEAGFEPDFPDGSGTPGEHVRTQCRRS